MLIISISSHLFSPRLGRQGGKNQQQTSHGRRLPPPNRRRRRGLGPEHGLGELRSLRGPPASREEAAVWSGQSSRVGAFSVGSACGQWYDFYAGGWRQEGGDMDGPRRMSEGGEHKRRVGTCAGSGSSRYLFFCWAFVAWHESMQPFYLMPCLSLTRVQTRASAGCGDSYKCGMNERIVWLVLDWYGSICNNSVSTRSLRP